MIGLLTGSLTYELPGLSDRPRETVRTKFGDAEVTIGELHGVEVAHISRHGVGHIRLSNHVNHRANIVALKQLGCSAALGLTVCGAVDTTVPLGGLLAFDDLHFLSNRLADGSLCTLFETAGEPGRGHWVFEQPFATGLRSAVLDSASSAGLVVRDGGCYGHVDGPRFNTAAEIRSLSAVGVTAVSQTAGPETVLAGEAELPYALVGYVTDYANGASSQHTPINVFSAMLAASGESFAKLIEAALPAAASLSPEPPGSVFRF